MGWTSCREWKKPLDVVNALLQERTGPWNHCGVVVEDTCLSYTVVAAGMWSVWERRAVNGEREAERFISFDLIEGDRAAGFGYKDMGEMVHPYYYDCPLEYLDMTPVACEEWRTRVRAYWQGVPQRELLRQTELEFQAWRAELLARAEGGEG